jgi:hypothetical protein
MIQGECGTYSMGGAKVECDRGGLPIKHDGAYSEVVNESKYPIVSTYVIETH